MHVANMCLYGQVSSQSLKVEVLMRRMHKVKHSQVLEPKSLLLWPIDFSLNHIFAAALFSMASLTSSSAFTANETMFFSRSPPLPVSSSVESVGPCSLATANATYPLGRILFRTTRILHRKYRVNLRRSILRVAPGRPSSTALWRVKSDKSHQIPSAGTSTVFVLTSLMQ